MRLVVTGGGTGGHIYPALAVAEAVLAAEPNAAVLYIGTESGLEARLVPPTGIPFATVRAAGIIGKSLLARLHGGLALLAGIGQAYRRLRRFRPDVVLGTGGYVSAPVVFAAWLLRIPIAIQEQNALPGAANRLLAKFATDVYLPFAAARTHFDTRARTRVTGNPVRPDIVAAARDEARQALAVPREATVLFVSGGSRGAASIHAAMAGALPALLARPELIVMYVTGDAYFAEVEARLQAAGLAEHPRLRLLSYAHDMPALLAAADVAVVRAGAMTVAELAVRGLPAVIIPSPNVANNHQEYNARIMNDAGAAVLLPDHELSSASLLQTLAPLLDDPARRAAMGAKARAVAKPDALAQIVNCLQQLARSRKKGG